MKDTFVNRVAELEFLEQSLAKSSAQLLVLYGRRRVGKTWLLQHLAHRSKVPVLYHVCVQTTPVDELSRLSRRLAEFFEDPVLAVQSLGSWEACLAYLGHQAEKRPFGLLLDEFPYAVEGDPSLPSRLQASWDARLRRTRIKLVLSGSSISMMEDIGLSPRSPLHGRRTGQWKLEPFGVREIGLLWPMGSFEDVLSLYCVVGGSPMYVTQLEPSKGLAENIRDSILARGSLLYDEVPFLLRSELRSPRVYQSILGAIARGARKFSELSSKTGLERAHLTRYLATLCELGLVAREVPVTEWYPEKSRRGLYRIADHFVDFWYRFVFPNRDRLECGDTAMVLEDEVLPSLDAYIAGSVEPVIGSLFRHDWVGRVPFVSAYSGRHWSNLEEFDWVLLDHSRTRAMVVEIKWSRAPIRGVGTMKDLARRAAACDALRECSRTHALVSRSGFADRPRSTGDELFVDLTTEALPWAG
ncbi:MAG: ATP-binding protein [Candidatus Riflebacteria bacterium]|nr:ATP-binding protein [Candidatus Riflebacteria bacterium]